jgi:predicted ABC-type transport system involved in lysophospholipase L1 biosynthesis ATPase subunit
MLTLDRIAKHYPGPAGAPPVEVLKGISLTVGAGESVAVTGPSGCGKTTLLQIMGALDRPSAGTARFREEDLGGLDEEAACAFRRRHLGFIFQHHALLPQCTAVENVLIPRLAAGRATDKDREKARDLLAELGLGARLDHRPGELSGGECQRVAVARALIGEPALLLADEPTGALDEANAREITDLLLRLQSARGVALVVVTHSPEVAARMSRRLRLRDGALEA